MRLTSYFRPLLLFAFAMLMVLGFSPSLDAKAPDSGGYVLSLDTSDTDTVSLSTSAGYGEVLLVEPGGGEPVFVSEALVPGPFDRGDIPPALSSRTTAIAHDRHHYRVPIVVRE